LDPKVLGLSMIHIVGKRFGSFQLVLNSHVLSTRRLFFTSSLLSDRTGLALRTCLLIFQISFLFYRFFQFQFVRSIVVSSGTVPFSELILLSVFWSSIHIILHQKNYSRDPETHTSSHLTITTFCPANNSFATTEARRPSR
jgi:hypothetical protein